MADEQWTASSIRRAGSSQLPSISSLPHLLSAYPSAAPPFQAFQIKLPKHPFPFKMKIAFLAALPAFAAIASGAAVPQDVSAAAVPARFWDKPNFQGQRFDGVRGVCSKQASCPSFAI